MQKQTATPWFPPRASVSPSGSARPAPGASSGGGSGCRNRPRARPPRLPPPGPSPPATGSSGRAAGRRRRRRGGCRAPRPSPPAPGLRSPPGAPGASLPARLWDLESGLPSPARDSCPLPCPRARRLLCGRSSWTSPGPGRLAALRTHLQMRRVETAVARPLGDARTGLGGSKRPSGLPEPGRGDWAPVGGRSGIAEPGIHPSLGQPTGTPGGKWSSPAAPRETKGRLGRRECAAPRILGREGGHGEEEQPEKCGGVGGEHGRGARSPSKEGN